MSNATKLLESMRSNPRDWRIEQLHTVSRQYGIVVRSTGGSHHVFAHDLVADTVSVPAHRPIKPIYIRQFVALVDKVEAAQAEKENKK
jgi:predicted RNA binding protein YcfA (HicA-like mRNA interferase family)